MCLNPYCSGRWSRTGSKCRHAKKAAMGLNPYCSGQWSSTLSTGSQLHSKTRLNPYCSGRWSRTTIHARSLLDPKLVLILVVKENGLVR